ncbi:zinc ABC transporter substrate-binding protein [soil metagenome]
MVADLVSRVGGDEVKLVALMGAGVDPHLYKPSASDAAELQRADVIFYSGHHLEGRMADLFEKMGARGKLVVPVAEAIPEDELVVPEDAGGLPDPHVWGDASLWATAIDPVAETLSRVLPERADEIAARADAYRRELGDLHEWAKARVAELPEGQRVLITSHDAFNYFGRAYGFEVIGVQGLSTVSEAGLADIAKTVDLIRERGVKAIFVESSVSPAAIERISRDSGASIGGELFSDAMGTPGEIETAAGESYDVGTYVGMLKHNVNTAVEALR